MFGVEVGESLFFGIGGLLPYVGAFVDRKKEAVLFVPAGHASEAGVGEEHISLGRHELREKVSVIEELSLARSLASCGDRESGVLDYSLAIVCLLRG